MSFADRTYEDQFDWINDQDSEIVVRIEPWEKTLSVGEGEDLLAHGSSSTPGSFHWSQDSHTLTAWQGCLVSISIGGWAAWESPDRVPAISRGDANTDFYGLFGLGKSE